MSGKNSAKQDLKDLLEITTYSQSSGFIVGKKEPFENDNFTIRSLGRQLNLNTAKPTRIFSDGKKLLSSFLDKILNGEFREHKNTFTNGEWQGIACQSLADVLLTYDEKKLKQVKKTPENFYYGLKETIKEKVAEFQEKQYVFGCHLSNIDLEPFIIGPVRIEPRLTWLDRSTKEDKLGSIDVEVIRTKWCGEITDKKQNGSIQTKAMLDTVGKAKYVCSVELNRSTGGIAGRFIALRVARLALTTIALGFLTPSRALEYIHLTWDEKYNIQHLYIYERNGNSYESNRSYYPGGIQYLSRDKWGTLQTEMSATFEAAGKVIAWYVEGSNDQPANLPKLNNHIFYAMLWFNKGCQEEDDQMAIHHFMASLDSLAGGKKGYGIKPLLENTGFSEDAIKEIGNLYTPNRSRFAHGNPDRLGHVSINNRSKAEIGARVCLLYCLDRFSRYEGDFDNQFLFSEKNTS